MHSRPNGHVTLTAEIPSRTLVHAGARVRHHARRPCDRRRAPRRRRTSTGAWADYERQWLPLRRRTATARPLARPRPRSASTTSRSTWSRPARTRRSRARSPPAWPRRGARRYPPATFTNGQPTYFGSYREVFARDLYEAFTGLLVAGDIRTAQAARCSCSTASSSPTGRCRATRCRTARRRRTPAAFSSTRPPIRSSWTGSRAWPRDSSLYKSHVIPAADFLVAHGPSDGVERWEEQSGYSPSTIAAEIAGLTAAATIARVNQDRPRAGDLSGHGRRLRPQHREVDGDDHRAVHQLKRAELLHPRVQAYAATRTPPITYSLNNGNSTQVDQRSVIDAGFLELVRLGVLPASDPGCAELAQGGRRHDRAPDAERPRLLPLRLQQSRAESEDGYGDCFVPPSGPRTRRAARRPARRGRAPTPATNRHVGTGHLWPVLSGRARRVRDRRRRLRLRPATADRDAEHDLGPGARARAGLGGPGRCLPRRSAPIRPPPRSGSPTASPQARPAR